MIQVWDGDGVDRTPLEKTIPLLRVRIDEVLNANSFDRETKLVVKVGYGSNSGTHTFGFRINMEGIEELMGHMAGTNLAEVACSAAMQIPDPVFVNLRNRYGDAFAKAVVEGVLRWVKGRYPNS